jgi:hypothetical protein
MFGVLGGDALHDPKGHRRGDDADEGNAAEHQGHRDHSTLTVTGCKSLPAVVLVVIDHHTASPKFRMLASGSGRSA